jgi:hypothetical protein
MRVVFVEMRDHGIVSDVVDVGFEKRSKPGAE